MNDLSNEEYADMHLMYGLAEGNAAQAVRYYVHRFQGRRVLDRRTFIRVDRSLRETGSFKPKPGGVERPRQSRTVEAEEHVLQLVEKNASTSVRKLSSECNITKTIVHDILQEQLLFPYHIQKVHAMSEADYAPRVEFCTVRSTLYKENMLKSNIHLEKGLILTHPSGEGNNNPGQLTTRDAIKRIRFLTLTPQQFAEGPGKSSLLSESEKFAILMNICSPSAATSMPEGFSISTVTRKKKQPEFFPTPAFMMAGIPSMDTSRTSMIKFSSLAAEGSNDSSKRMICNRTLLRTTECMNTSVLDCAVTFTCDKNVCVYGIQVPAQIPMDEERQQQMIYPELLYAHLLDAEGSRLTYTHFTSRVHYHSLIEISFNRPVYIQRNKVYKVGVVLNKIGCYPIGTYPSQSTCNGVTFTFSQGQGGDSVRDGLIRSIIFSMPPVNNNVNNNPGISGIPGDHNMQPSII